MPSPHGQCAILYTPNVTHILHRHRRLSLLLFRWLINVRERPSVNNNDEMRNGHIVRKLSEFEISDVRALDSTYADIQFYHSVPRIYIYIINRVRPVRTLLYTVPFLSPSARLSEVADLVPIL